MSDPNLNARALTAALLFLAPLAGCDLEADVVENGDETGDEDLEEVDPVALGNGTGLTGAYFSDVNLGTLKGRRLDTQVAFTWGTGAPMAGLAADGFSVRWSGEVEAPTTGTYLFTTRSDDGVRLRVDGELLVDNWTRHAPTANSGSIGLVGGERYALTMEYYEETGGATAILEYTPPGSTSRVIPTRRLYPAAAPPPVGGGAVTISGNRLLRDGVPWTPKGFSMIGALTCGAARTAAAQWGTAEIAVAKSWGGDSFRFQISQPFLDPADPKHDPAYLTRVKSMVAQARSNGFVVILSMQDQSLACGDATPMPTTSTQRA